jgi:hypothetical protein
MEPSGRPQISQSFVFAIGVVPKKCRGGSALERRAMVDDFGQSRTPFLPHVLGAMRHGVIPRWPAAMLVVEMTLVVQGLLVMGQLGLVIRAAFLTDARLAMEKLERVQMVVLGQ